MEQRHLGRTGLRVSRLGLGTLTWGRNTGERDAADQLKAFWDAGGTLIDTADVYADGGAEYLLGRLLEDLVPREDLVIATKAGSVPDPDRRFDTSRGHLLSALDASLQRLGTDYVDLWQVHAFDAGTPLDETLRALDIAVSSGRARYVGVSNFCGWQLAKAATWQLAVPGRTPLASTQLEYSLLQRGVEREVLPAAMDLGVGLLPSSPLGRGVLTGKYRQSTPLD
jgi:aryl-alcohol dehydrogenase-like predicted oxidoreductase